MKNHFDWCPSEATLAALQFTEWARDVDAKAQGRDFLDGYPGDGRADWLRAQDRGWVRTVDQSGRRYACVPGVVPWPWPKATPSGRLEVDRVQGLRSDRRARRTACRDAIVLWLADVGEVEEIARFVTERPYDFYGTPFDLDEVHAATAYLEAQGLIAGIKVWGPGLIRASLTARGESCADYYNGNVQNYLNPRTAERTVNNNMHFHGPANGQFAQGQNVHQHQVQHNGLDAAALEEIFKAMREALSHVEDLQMQDDLRRDIDELEEAAGRGDADAVVERAGRLQRLANLVGSTALTTATSTGVTQLLQVFGAG